MLLKKTARRITNPRYTPPPTEFVGYDFEALGLMPWTDHPTQAGFVRFSPTMEPEVELNVKICLSPYSVPGPKALEVTDLQPEDLNSDERISEYEAAAQLANFLTERPSDRERVYFGYNILGYDEELMRAFMFRNLQEPYWTSGRGVSKIDLLPTVRFLHHIRPGIIKPGSRPDGTLSWRLEHVIAANGLSTDQSHEAVEDAYSAADLLNIILQEAPDVLWTCIKRSNKNKIKELLEQNIEEDGHVVEFTYWGEPKLSPLKPITTYGAGGNTFLCVELDGDLQELIDLPAEELQGKVFSKDSPFRIMKANACPFVFAKSTKFLPAQRNMEQVRANIEVLQDSAIRSKLVQVAALLASESKDKFREKKLVSEKAIYDGFVGRDDKHWREQFNQAESWEERLSMVEGFDDPRLKEFALRIIGSNAPEDVQDFRTAKALSRQIRLRLSDDPRVMKDIQTISAAREELDNVEDDAFRAKCSVMLDDVENRMRETLEVLKDYEQVVTGDAPAQMNLF